MKKKTKQVKISPGEMEMLSILWDIKSGTISQVHKEHTAQGNNVTYATIQTRLNRLVEKGAAVRVGFPGEYRALLKPENVHDLYYDKIEKLCGGSVAPFLAHLFAKREFDAEEIAVLEKIVAAKR
jgi:predicted transcriptional regulator